MLAQAPGKLRCDLLRGSGGLVRHTRQNTVAAHRPLKLELQLQLQAYPDGSDDLYFGPKAPPGKDRTG